MRGKTKTDGNPSGERDSSIVSPNSKHRPDTRLEIPAGEPDLEALRSVTREWLVPLLVEKFLREQGIRLRGRPTVARDKTPLPGV
jgi:hypothetical protein